MAGKAMYTELFSAGSGNRYVKGFQGQLNIKHDGNGSVMVDPMSGMLSNTPASSRLTVHQVSWIAHVRVMHPTMCDAAPCLCMCRFNQHCRHQHRGEPHLLHQGQLHCEEGANSEQQQGMRCLPYLLAAPIKAGGAWAEKACAQVHLGVSAGPGSWPSHGGGRLPAGWQRFSAPADHAVDLRHIRAG